MAHHRFVSSLAFLRRRQPRCLLWGWLTEQSVHVTKPLHYNLCTFLLNMWVTGSWIHFCLYFELCMCPGRFQCRGYEWGRAGFGDGGITWGRPNLTHVWSWGDPVRQLKRGRAAGRRAQDGQGWEGFRCRAAPYGLELEFPSYISLYRGHHKGGTGRIQLVARVLNDLLSGAYAAGAFIDKSSHRGT